MNSETSFLIPPIFNGENYQGWAIRMTVHLEALDLWEAVEEDNEVTPLGDNPTVNQIRHHKERKTRKAKAKACLFSAVSPSFLTRIMQMKSTTEIWEYLEKEYQGNERVQNMQVMNLIREFEMKRMKESETIKDYADQLLDLANKVRLFGKDFTDERIIQKILVTLPEKYEATISSLENSKDLSSITSAELINALTDVKYNKCDQLGHVERVCKSQTQQEEAKPAVNQYEEEQLFVATCFAIKNTSKNWLIDSECTNHMTSDQKLFKELDKFVISKPYSVGQLLENDFKVLFEEKACVIKDSDNKEMFKFKMRGRSFSLNLLDDEQATIVRLENDSELCNKRLEHYHRDAILFMKENQLGEGLPSLKKNLLACEACRYGKQTRLSFLNSSWKPKNKLQLVHTDVGGPQKTPSLKGMFNNFYNEAAISIANNLVSHGKTKHFKIKLYFLRKVQKNGDINMVNCRTDFQTADILTKSLPRARFKFLIERLGVTALESRRSVKISASKAAD
ncbi:hypothetical protein P3S68_016434 [Capsicum galapagoense]